MRINPAVWCAGAAFVLAAIAIGTGHRLRTKTVTVPVEASAKQDVMPTEPILFSSLKNADEMLALDIVEIGCYSWQRYRLEYVPLPSPRVTVYEYDTGSNKDLRANQKMKTTTRRIGMVTLTATQVARFDNSLRGFRTKPIHPVTEDDSVTIALFCNGVKRTTERYSKETYLMSIFADADPRDISADPDCKKWYPDARPELSQVTILETAIKSGKVGTPLPYVDLPREKTWIWFSLHMEEEIAKRKRK